MLDETTLHIHVMTHNKNAYSDGKAQVSTSEGSPLMKGLAAVGLLGVVLVRRQQPLLDVGG